MEVELMVHEPHLFPQRFFPPNDSSANVDI